MKDTTVVDTIPTGAVIDPPQSNLLSHTRGLQVQFQTHPEDESVLYAWVENEDNERVYFFSANDLDVKFEGENDNGQNENQET